MSIEKKSLINTHKTTNKARAASGGLKRTVKSAKAVTKCKIDAKVASFSFGASN